MTARPFVLAAALCLAVQTAALAGPREDARVLEATQVLIDKNEMPDQRVPDWLLQRAQGIAILPTVVKAGLGIGGRGGKGVLVVRNAQGRWSNPAFITLAGGSIGWQIGVETSDIVLVFTTRRGVEGLTGGKVTLGADASVAAGPVGRQASGATDLQFQAEVYSYSRAKGLFAGIAIDGSVISIDHSANASFYDRPGVLASDIFSATAPAPPENARRLLDAIRRLPGGDDSGTAPAAAMPAAAPSPAGAAPPAQPPPSGSGLESGATAYPLDQSKPH
jgi:lipid-binding SYLF domain-containing protein